MLTKLCLALCLFAVALRAAPPPGYYDRAQGRVGEDLRAALHAIIRRHHLIPYSSSSRLDTSDALKALDALPGDTNRVLLIYSGSNALASTFGLTTGWNREHLWPNSYGLDDTEPSFSDLHNLRACDANVNSARGNKLYALSNPGSPGYRNPAHVESALATADSDSWEPPAHQRGDIARALFYMATRYTGDTNNEPALILTDRLELIQATNTYMGRLSTLLAWHEADPVDDAERLRNDLVYTWQTNRNPYIDRPEWVRLIFWPNLEISPEPGGTHLSWSVEYRDAVLESAATLPDSWVLVTNTITTQGPRRTILLPAIAGPHFFRLKLP